MIGCVLIWVIVVVICKFVRGMAYGNTPSWFLYECLVMLTDCLKTLSNCGTEYLSCAMLGAEAFWKSVVYLSERLAELAPTC